MSVETKLFIPGSYTTSDVQTLLKSANPDLDISVTSRSYARNTLSEASYADGTKEAYSHFSVESVTVKGREKPQTITIVERIIDLRKSKDPSYFGIDENSGIEESAAGLMLESHYNSSGDLLSMTTLLENVWKKHGGYFCRNDAEDDFVFCPGSDPGISSDVRAENMAKVATDQALDAIARSVRVKFSEDSIEQVKDGLNILLSSAIKHVLDDYAERVEKDAVRKSTSDRSI